MDEAALDRFDRMYRYFNQTERESCRILEARGHPNAGEHRELRDFYDSLRHCANSNARFYSFQNEGENTEYWAPELHVRNTRGIHPCDGQAYVDLLNRINFGGSLSQRVCQKLGHGDVITGAEADPYLTAGSWIISTRNEKFFNAIERLEGRAGIHVCHKDVPRGHRRASEMRPHNGYDHFTARIFLDDLEQFRIVKRVVDLFVTPLERRVKPQEIGR